MSIRETNFRTAPPSEATAADASGMASVVDLPSLTGLDGVMMIVAAAVGMAAVAWVVLSARRNAPRPTRAPAVSAPRDRAPS